MRTARKKRLYLILLMLIGVAVAAVLALNAFNQNLMYFYSPTEVTEGKAPADRAFRVGGLVVEDSLQRQPDGLTVRFDVSDNAAVVPVSYTGILPDLFREGQGVIARGALGDDGVFAATEVLAKHDENYMPPEVADALEATGHVSPTNDG